VRWAKDYLRHEAAWVAVETEYSVLNLVFCHQPLPRPASGVIQR
jgi:hypothetical protein